MKRIIPKPQQKYKLLIGIRELVLLKVALERVKKQLEKRDAKDPDVEIIDNMLEEVRRHV